MLHGNKVRNITEYLQKMLFLTLFECTVDDFYIYLRLSAMLVEKTNFFHQILKDAATARMRVCRIVKPLDRDADAPELRRNQRTRKFLRKGKPIRYDVDGIRNPPLRSISNHIRDARMKQRFTRPGKSEHLQ